MPGMLMNYTYTDTATGNTYSGQVVADSSMSQYNYQPGATYDFGTGYYTMSTAAPVATNAPSGAVYQTSYYDKANNTTYDSYHYDVRDNAYYDVKTDGYSPTTGMYQPPTPMGGTAPPSVPMWSSTGGLGSEYGYIKTPNGYGVYGGGSTATAEITPGTLTTYDFQFMYPNGSYYDGTVYDNGTYGYKVGATGSEPGGTYSIYAASTTPPPAGALAGETYALTYYDITDKAFYAPSDITSGTPYYNKPDGYGGLSTVSDYIHKTGGYYHFNDTSGASASTPIAALPLPT